MSHRASTGLLLVIQLALAGTAGSCMMSLSVKSDPQSSDPNRNGESRYEDPPGIPFYVKHGACRQETTWLEPLYTLTLTVGKASQMQSSRIEPDEVETKTLAHSDYVAARDSLANKARGMYRMLGKHDDSRKKLWTAIKDLPDYDPFRRVPNTKDLVLESNKSAPVAYVDYSRTYYLNSRRPWFGSASTTAELAKDGTLTKGSATVESKTLEAVLDALPIGELFTSAPPSEDPNASFAANEVVSLLEIRKTIYRHRIAKVIASPAFPCSVGERIELTEANMKTHEYSREEVGAGAAGGDKPGKDKIGIKGEVDLSGVK